MDYKKYLKKYEPLMEEIINEVLRRDSMSPEDQERLDKARAGHKKTDIKERAKRPIGPEIHKKSPLSKKEKKEKDKAAAKTPDRIVRYKREAPGHEGAVGGYDPDDLWREMGLGDKTGGIPFIYIPRTDELFYISEKINDDRYNMRNWDAGMNPEFEDKLWERGRYARTHSDIAWNINQLIARKEEFKSVPETYKTLESYVTSIRPQVVLGRYFNKKISYWNAMEDAEAEKITKKVEKANNVKAFKIFVPTENVDR